MHRLTYTIKKLQRYELIIAWLYVSFLFGTITFYGNDILDILIVLFGMSISSGKGQNKMTMMKSPFLRFMYCDLSIA